MKNFIATKKVLIIAMTVVFVGNLFPALTFGLEKGIYRLINVDCGLALRGDGHQRDADLWGDGPHKGKKWKFIPEGNDVYRLINVDSGQPYGLMVINAMPTFGGMDLTPVKNGDSSMKARISIA